LIKDVPENQLFQLEIKGNMEVMMMVAHLYTKYHKSISKNKKGAFLIRKCPFLFLDIDL
jgi:hypothetical protein